MTRQLIVDAANVVGSRPDGWWRDRPGAAARLCAQIEAAVDAGDLEPPVVVVLEGAARSGREPGSAGAVAVAVVHADGSGDDTIAALVAAAAAAAAAVPTVVVTSDRGLRERVRRAGGEVVGAGWLLDRMDRTDRTGRPESSPDRHQ